MVGDVLLRRCERQRNAEHRTGHGLSLMLLAACCLVALLYVAVKAVRYILSLLTSSGGDDGWRVFGNFEYLFDAINRTCGHHNITEQISEDALRVALDRLQARFAVLRAEVTYTAGLPHFTPIHFEEGEPPRVPMDVATMSTECEWEEVLEREMNCGFSRGECLMRCVLLKPREAQQGDVLVATVRHDVMDGKSGAILFGEIMSEYHDALHVPDEEYVAREAVPIAPPVDCLVPWWMPTEVSFLVHFARFLWKMRFGLSLPDNLPHTATPCIYQSGVKRRDARLGRWLTRVIHRRLSVEDTGALISACKRNATTVGSFLYGALDMHTAKLITTYSGTSGATVWGVMILDMRGIAAMRHEGGNGSGIFDPHGIGLFISTIEFKHSMDRERIINTANVWSMARDVRSEFHAALNRLEHFSGLVFVRAMAEFSSFFSYYFIQPCPAPCFSLSNLGDVSKSTLGHYMRHSPFLRDFNVGVTSGSSYPMPLCTVMTLNGEMRITFSYASDTMSDEFATEYADSFIALLRSASQTR